MQATDFNADVPVSYSFKGKTYTFTCSLDYTDVKDEKLKRLLNYQTSGYKTVYNNVINIAQKKGSDAEKIKKLENWAKDGLSVKVADLLNAPRSRKSPDQVLAESAKRLIKQGLSKEQIQRELEKQIELLLKGQEK